MNETIKLLRVVGSPLIETSELPQDDKEAGKLYVSAIKNKIPLLYLDRLKQQGRSGEFETIYDERKTWQRKLSSSISRVSEILEDLDIEYALIKTIKPYPAVPNDVDILCLGTNNEYIKAKQALLKAGYEKLFPKVPAARQIKLCHPEDNVWIDLHKEVGVSAIICMNKRILKKYATEVKLSDGRHTKTLVSPADLAVIIIHSLITEQLYTLGEFYATILWLADWNQPEIDSFISIVRENNITLAARTHISITSLLHKEAFGVMSAKLDQILAELGAEPSESSRCKENNFKVPHRYRLLTVTRALLEKMKDRETRKSIPSQMQKMLNPAFLRILIKDIKGHRTREAQEEVF